MKLWKQCCAMHQQRLQQRIRCQYYYHRPQLEIVGMKTAGALFYTLPEIVPAFRQAKLQPGGIPCLI